MSFKKSKRASNNIKLVILVFLFLALPMFLFAVSKRVNIRSKASNLSNIQCNFVTKWGELGSGNGQFQYPGSIATDIQGNVYVGDHQNYRIQKFDADGDFILSWGSNGSSNGQFGVINDIFISSDQKVYVTDHNDPDNLERVQVFDTDGNFISTFGYYGTGNGAFVSPSHVALDSTGAIYVTDGFLDRTQKFTNSGQFILKILPQTPDGPYSRMADIAVTDDLLHITDNVNKVVGKYDFTGNFQGTWGGPGSGDGQFENLSGIIFRPSDQIFFTVDGIQDRVQIFDQNGLFLAKFGEEGSGDGQFFIPVDITDDLSGNIFVLESGNNRVQKFNCIVPPTPTPTPSEAPTPTPVLNLSPVISTSSLAQARVGQSYNRIAEGYDEDLGDILTMSAIGLPVGLQVTNCRSNSSDKVYLKCSVTGTPTQEGVHNVTFTLSDNHGASTDKIIPLTVLPPR